MTWKDWSTMMRLTFSIFIMSLFFTILTAYLYYGPPFRVYVFLDKPNPIAPVYVGEHMTWRMHVHRFLSM